MKKETAYRIVKFDLLILIGAADLRFQVHPRGETDTLASREHEEIDVVWMKRKKPRTLRFRRAKESSLH